MLVEEAHQPIEFEQRVLQRRSGEKDLWATADRVLDGPGDLTVRLVHVPQAVGLVHDHEIPRDGTDGFRSGSREVVGAHNDGVVAIEWIRPARLQAGIEHPGVEDRGLDEELLLQFLHPLIPERRRHDRQDAPPALGPELADDEPRLDGLAQADLVRQEGAAGQRRAERKERRVDLMGVQIDRRVHERRAEFLQAVRGAPPPQQVGVVLSVVVGNCLAP